MSFAAALNVRNIDYAQVIGGADDTEESGTIMGLLKGIYHKLLSHKMWIFNVNEMYIFTSSLTASNFENDKLYLSRTTTSSISVAGLPAQIYIANRVYKCSKTNDTVTGFEEIVLDSNILINNILTNQKYIYDGVNLLCITIGREYNSRGEMFNDYNHNKASGNYSHAEGNNTTASGSASHAEGYRTTASGQASHVEGYATTASGMYSHAEGSATSATGFYTHAEGSFTSATGYNSHAGGQYTIANSTCMTALGQYNTNDGTAYNALNRLLVVGNGTASARSDAFEVYNSGEVKINSTASGSTPKLTIGSSLSITATTAPNTSSNTGDDILTTKYYVDKAISGELGNLGNFKFEYKVSSNAYNSVYVNYINMRYYGNLNDIIFVDAMIPLYFDTPPSQHSNQQVWLQSLTFNGVEYCCAYQPDYMIFSNYTTIPCIGCYKTNNMNYNISLIAEKPASFFDYCYSIRWVDGSTLRSNVNLNNLWTINLSNVPFLKSSLLNV